MHIDLESLTEELSRGRAEVEGWVSSVKKQFEEYKNSDKNLRKAFKEHMTVLADKENVIREKVEKKEEVVKRYQKEISQRSDVVESLKEKEAPLLEQLSELKLQHEEASQALEEAVKRHERIKKELEYKKKDSERGLTYFQDRLGLQLRKIEGDSILFIFTCIDPRDPDREFFFQLRITDKYKVVKCLPELDNVGQLEEQLNSSIGTSQGYRKVMEFILAMRKEFKNTLYL